MHPVSGRFLIVALLLALSCGSDDVGPSGHSVGARCAADKDCAKRCLVGASFPGGYCTETCATAHDCPGSAACIALDGETTGLCVVPCRVANDCNAYGAGYQCTREPRQEGGEGVLVCIGGG
jgi:serine protease